MLKELQVTGMSCQHCQMTVEGTLEKLNGVSRVKAHLDTGRVEVDFDNAKISLDTIVKEIEELGYEVK